MNSYEGALNYESIKKYDVKPVYNDESTLEFHIKGDKHHLIPSDIMLVITCQIPVDFIIDNGAMNKLFDSHEILLNNDAITKRSNKNEHAYYDFFSKKCQFALTHDNLVSEGWFDSRNIDSSFFNSKDNHYSAIMSNAIIKNRIMGA